MQENNCQNAQDLMLLRQVCREAGELALRYFGHNPQVWMKPGDSPVSEADFAVDRLLKKRLLEARPNYGWISEETMDERAHQNYQRIFIVDPIDGTRGFLENSDYWCISVAVVENLQPVVGVLQCPVKNDVYAAEIHKGATLNNAPIHCALSGARQKKIISASNPMEKKLNKIFEDRFGFSRYIPSLAYRLALLAQGDIDGVLVRPNCHDWDIAAADLILKESGGALVNTKQEAVSYTKQPYRQDFLIASENSQLKKLIDVVQAAKLV